jgi:hypothetical protein
MQEAIESSRIVGELKPKHLEICHGKPVMNPADHLVTYIAEATKKYVQ